MRSLYKPKERTEVSAMPPEYLLVKTRGRVTAVREKKYIEMKILSLYISKNIH